MCTPCRTRGGQRKGRGVLQRDIARSTERHRTDPVVDLDRGRVLRGPGEGGRAREANRLRVRRESDDGRGGIAALSVQPDVVDAGIEATLIVDLEEAEAHGPTAKP